MTNPVDLAAVVARVEATIETAPRMQGVGMQDRIAVERADLRTLLAALAAAREDGAPVAWCPVDRNGHLYVEHANAPRELVETEVRELNEDGMGLAPYTIAPLYAARSEAPDGR